MSVRVMSLVWDVFPASGSELLAMLALADWCDDKGGSLYPSMKAVGEKIRVGEKQARRIMQTFVANGYLEVIGNAAGGAPGSTKHFRLNIDKLKALASKDELTPPADAPPPVNVAPPAQGSPTPPMEGSPPLPPVGAVPLPPVGAVPLPPVSETPPTHGSQTTIEPLIPNTNTGKAAPSPELVKEIEGVDAGTMADFLLLRKKKGAPLTVTAVKGIQREAEKAGWSMQAAIEEVCARGWTGFKADWVANKAGAETAYQQSMREKFEKVAPSVAARDPKRTNPNTFFDNLQAELTNA